MSMHSRSATPAGSYAPSIGSYDASLIHHYRRTTPSPERELAAGPSSPAPIPPTPPPRDQTPPGRPYTPSAASSISSFSRPHYARSASTSHSRARSQRAEILSLIMQEEDRQIARLHEANGAFADRLEHEMHRADLAEMRAQQAEQRARDAHAKAQTNAVAKQQADIEITRLHEENKRYRQQLDSVTRELKRAQAELAAMDQQRVDAEQAAIDARESARQYRAALEAQQAREAGLLEGRRLGLEESMRAYLLERQAPPSPRSTSSSADTRAAYQRGRARGYEEGRADGAAAEREHAMQAFDRFISNHEVDMPELMQDRKSFVSSRSAPSTPGRR